MCTVSWQTAESSSGDELLLYFNRDEMRQRSAGLEPELFEIDSVKYLSPIDPERGGTWIAANENGCLVCLLNDYSVKFDSSRKWESRGIVVRELACMKSREDVWHYFHSKGKLLCPPFTLLFWDGALMHEWHWDLSRLDYRENVKAPRTSSSWQTKRVEEQRIQLFRQLVEHEGESLESYHKYVIPGDAESSVCMARELTQTVSLTSVHIARNAVKMCYSPCDHDGNFLDEVDIVLMKSV